MAQPEFMIPDFIENNTAEEIHQRMMENLPDDIDDMPGGFPYDFTKPAALEKDEFINYHLTRALMIAFPQYAWDEWLDLHGQQVHLERHQPQKAFGNVEISGTAGTLITSGTIFCTPATDGGPSIEFQSQEDAVIGESGTVLIPVFAVESGTGSNVAPNAAFLMAKPNKEVAGVRNPEPIRGGTGRESNDDYYDRIAAEYQNSMTFLGNDSDYVRWAREAGAGDCVVIPAADGPGTVRLVLVDGNGQPANERLVQQGYDYIVSPNDRSRRLLPTACAELSCAAAVTVEVSYECRGLQYDGTTDMEKIKARFREEVSKVYRAAKKEGILRYNDVRPLISGIPGVEDFTSFTMNGGIVNIRLGSEEYPETGAVDFSGEEPDERT